MLHLPSMSTVSLNPYNNRIQIHHLHFSHRGKLRLRETVYSRSEVTGLSFQPHQLVPKSLLLTIHCSASWLLPAQERDRATNAASTGWTKSWTSPRQYPCDVMGVIIPLVKLRDSILLPPPSPPSLSLCLKMCFYSLTWHKQSLSQCLLSLSF